MNLLSIGAAYGVMVAVFQWGWGSRPVRRDTPLPIDRFIPMMHVRGRSSGCRWTTRCSSSRVKEEYVATGDNAEASCVGLATTARVITVGGADHDRACSSASCSATTRRQDDGSRPGDRGVRRRDDRAHRARAGDDGAARRRQLVAPEVARQGAPRTSTSKASPSSRPANTRTRPSPRNAPPNSSAEALCNGADIPFGNFCGFVRCRGCDEP